MVLWCFIQLVSLLTASVSRWQCGMSSVVLVHPQLTRQHRH